MEEKNKLKCLIGARRNNKSKVILSTQQVIDLMEMFAYLEKRLEEKDKEIELLRDNMMHFGERLKLVNDTKHRICEEIRNAFKKQFRDGMCGGRFEQVVPIDCFNSILNKIEKGE